MKAKSKKVLREKAGFKRCHYLPNMSCGIKNCAECYLKEAYEQGKKDAYKKTLKFVKMYSQNDDVSEIDLIPIMDWLVGLSK